MKKVYEKPQVYMERFELSQNIALCRLEIRFGVIQLAAELKMTDLRLMGEILQEALLQKDYVISQHHHIVIQMGQARFHPFLYPDEYYLSFICRHDWFC